MKELSKGFAICGINICKKRFNSYKSWEKHVLKKHKLYYKRHNKELSF